jgi:hypothetical protein
LELEARELEEIGVLELATELLELDAELGAELLLTASEQTAPVTTGFSARAPFLSPCTPKLTDWPG